MSESNLSWIPLSNLRAHPSNSNVMPGPLLEKLAAHIRRSGRYPPLIVRPAPHEPDAWQVLDGHHRWRVLEQLGHEKAHCITWHVDDDQALLLLATLNRLQGQDDPQRRSQLLAELSERLADRPASLARLLPERSDQIHKLLSLRSPRPEPASAPSLEEMPQAVHFFLLPAQRRCLEEALRKISPNREQALMSLVQRSQERGSTMDA